MPTVLVVDDSGVDRRLAAGLLSANPELTVADAASGRDALEAVARQAPDLVVTDLQMPDMDGLELVRALRQCWPGVPVMLMTGHGSEELAVQALKQGAASYIPKKNLARDLARTAGLVLDVARARQRQERLLQCLRRTEAEFELDNDPALIPALVSHLADPLVQMKLGDDNELVRLSVALTEALDNAIHHGNLQVGTGLRDADAAGFRRLVEERRTQAPYRFRRVHVLSKQSPAEVVYVVSDQGRGFDPSSLCPDPSNPAVLEEVEGRGLVLIRLIMDEVHFNDRGNQITMVKRFGRTGPTLPM
jgi:CheY-like chemotaxis protein